MGDIIDLLFATIKPRPLIKIGCDVRFCPNCERPLSYSSNKPFCRNCQKKVKFNHKRFLIRRVLH